MRNAKLLLRLGLAFVFLYVGISAFREPSAWIGFVPEYISQFIPADRFLQIHSVADIILGLWLLSGRALFLGAALSALTLAGIVFFNFASLDIIFRDIGLFFAALALAALSRR